MLIKQTESCDSQEHACPVCQFWVTVCLWTYQSANNRYQCNENLYWGWIFRNWFFSQMDNFKLLRWNHWKLQCNNEALHWDILAMLLLQGCKHNRNKTNFCVILPAVILLAAVDSVPACPSPIDDDDGLQHTVTKNIHSLKVLFASYPEDKTFNMHINETKSQHKKASVSCACRWSWLELPKTAFDSVT